MLQLFLLVTFLLPFLPQISCFNCDSVKNSTLCADLVGCKWDTEICDGKFVSSCKSGTCYYIDPIEGSDSSNGSASAPFKTLTPGFQNLSRKNGELIVVNYLWNIEVEILRYTVVNSNVTISGLFNVPYVLSLKSFNASTIPSYQSNVITINASKLEIIGCVISDVTMALGINTIFELGDAKLFLKDVLVENYQGAVRMVNSAANKTNAQFNYTGGKHKSSSFSFQLLSGSHTFSNIEFLDNRATDKLLYLGVTIAMTNLLVRGGSSLFLYLAKESTVTIENLTFDEYSGNFLDAANIYRFTMSSSTIRNISPTSSIPFIRLSGGGKIYPHYIKNTTFQNCTVKNSLILLEKNYQQMTIDNITMNDIRKTATDVQDYRFEDLEYRTDFPGGVCFLGRKSVALLLSNSTFRNIASHCIGLKSSSLALTNSTFDNSALEYTPNKISEDAIDEYSGVTWLNFKSGATDVSPGIVIKITSNKFYENKIKPKFGGALRFTGMFVLTLQLANNEFVNNIAVYGGAVYIGNPLVTLFSSNEVYKGNTAKKGGAIYKIGDNLFYPKGKLITITISNGTFVGNQAIEKGGSLFLDLQVLTMTNTSFVLSKAQDGGAIYYIQIHKKNDFANKTFQNNSFYSNYAINSGGAIKLLFDYEELNENPKAPSIFINNTDLKGLAISDGRPSHYIFSFFNVISEKKLRPTDDLENWINNSSLTTLTYQMNSSSYPSEFKLDHKSGHELSQIVVIEIFDNKNRLADYIDKESIRVGLHNSDDKIKQVDTFIAGSPVYFSFKRGRIVIKSSVKIVGRPRTTATLTFNGVKEGSNMLNDAQALIDVNMTLNFIDCEKGDIFNTQTLKCTTCEEGTYTLADPYSNGVCIKCDPKRAVCLGGWKISPNPGYWRFDTSTANILECPAIDACIGGFQDERYFPNGLCAYPYEGNLCNKCADNYARFGSSTKCVNCETDVMYYIKFVGFSLIQIAALLYGVKCNLSKISEVKKAHRKNDNDLKDHLNNQDFHSNLMKIALNFLQVTNIVIQFKFEWPKFIKDVFGVTNKIMPTDKDGFSIDCILALIAGKNDYVNFIKLVVVLVQPFCMWLISVLCYLIYLKCKKKSIIGNPRVGQDIMVLFIVTAFILQPGIIQSTLEIFKCENFSSHENPVYFMVQNTDTQCWTSYHLFWALGIALPHFLLWTIILPLLLLRKLRLNAKNLKDPEIYAKFAFVYAGLKTDKYYWEFVILARKTLIVLIFVFFSIISVQSQAFSTFLVIVAFTSLHYKCWPYSDDKLNKAEMMSLASLAVMIYCGMFFLSNGGNDWLTIILIVLSCFFNLGFFIVLILLFVKSLKKTARRITRRISEITEKIKQNRRLTRMLSASAAYEKKSTIFDLKDVSIILNRTDIEPKQATTLDQIRNSESARLNLVENRDQEEDYVPNEIDIPQLASRKTIFNRAKNEISNHSILRNSRFNLPQSIRSPKNTSVTIITPEMLQDMIHLTQFKTSLVTSNDQKYLGRSFSAFDKGEELIKKEAQTGTELENQND